VVGPESHLAKSVKNENELFKPPLNPLLEKEGRKDEIKLKPMVCTEKVWLIIISHSSFI